MITEIYCRVYIQFLSFDWGRLYSKSQMECMIVDDCKRFTEFVRKPKIPYRGLRIYYSDPMLIDTPGDFDNIVKAVLSCFVGRVEYVRIAK